MLNKIEYNHYKNQQLFLLVIKRFISNLCKINHAEMHFTWNFCSPIVIETHCCSQCFMNKVGKFYPSLLNSKVDIEFYIFMICQCQPTSNENFDSFQVTILNKHDEIFFGSDQSNKRSLQ